MEVTRCCTDGSPNTCTQLYGAIGRAAAALGYHRLITYTHATEPGTSLRAAGFQPQGTRATRPWNRPGRPRKDATDLQPKTLWSRQLRQN